jgi:homoserine kinase
MTERVIVRAPASTANLGPGFDCAAAALDLWNELEVERGEHAVTVEGAGAAELPTGDDHLALRAFALVAPIEDYRFHFTNRIPLERGLGSSAATVAAGLVAACAVTGRTASADELLELGLPLEGHADNLAAALQGGVCLIWQNGAGPRAQRIAATLPLEPVVVVPSAGRVNTLASRDRLPEQLSHDEAAAAAAHAALLGAAIAAGDAELLANAFHDRLHEPYRLDDAPLLAALRERPVGGQVGVTLSGSGPSVVVWTHDEAAVVPSLQERFPDADVLPLHIATEGAQCT